MRFRRLMGPTILALAALLVAGCGEDEDEATSASNDRATIVKADFIQAANAICQKRGREVKAKSQRILAASGNKSRNVVAKELVEEAVAPAFEREADEIRDLAPPSGEEEQVEELVGAIDEMIARTRRDLSANRNYPYRKTENIAAAYGLPDCGRP
jgi:ABC-type Fe3+-hydroxamate transport system substrate-binding protein